MSSTSDLANMVGSLVKSGAVAALDVKPDGAVHLDFRANEQAANDAPPSASQPATAGFGVPAQSQANGGKIKAQMDAMVNAGIMDPTHRDTMNAVLQQHHQSQTPSTEHLQTEKRPVAKDTSGQPVLGQHTAKLAAANIDPFNQVGNGNSR